MWKIPAQFARYRDSASCEAYPKARTLPPSPSLLKRHETSLDSGLGCYHGPPEELKNKGTPNFHKARPVEYAQKPKVEKALRKMEEEVVIKRVNSAPCAAPIMVVNKRDSEDVSMCGDFSVTYNSCADVETLYPLPKIEDIHEAVRGCKLFTILDISQACHQIPVATYRVTAIPNYQYTHGTMLIPNTTSTAFTLNHLCSRE